MPSNTLPLPTFFNRHIFRFALVILCAANLGLASSFEEGHQAYLNRDYEIALSILQPLAERGNADAQETLSIMYDFGYGVRKDPVKALHWYEKAALQGKPLLQHDLGVRYFRGDGIPQSYDKASIWWERAARAGVVESQYNLGLMFAQGLGVTKNYREAVRWYEQAAQQNHANAQYSLGIMYAFGQGIDLDYAEALHYFARAADQGVAQAQYNLAVLYENGRGTHIDLSKAKRWYEAAANQGLKQAKLKLETLSKTPASTAAKSLSRLGFNENSTGSVQKETSDRERELARELEAERNKVASLSHELNSNVQELERLTLLVSERERQNQEVDDRIVTLNRQLQASRKYVAELKKQLDSRDEEDRALKLLVASIEKERETLTLSLENRERESEQLKQRLKQANLQANSNSDLRAKQTSLQQEFDAAIASQRKLERELQDAKLSIHNFKQLVAEREAGDGNQRSLLSRISAERDNIQNALFAKELEAKKLKDEIMQLKSSVKGEQKESAKVELEAKLTETRHERDNLAHELKLAKTNAARLHQTLKNISSEGGRKDWEEVNNKYREAVRLADQQSMQLATLRRDHGKSTDELAALRAQLSSSETISKRLSEELENKSSQLTRLTKENESSASKQKQLEQNVAALNSQLSRAKEIIAHLKQQVETKEQGFDIKSLPDEGSMQAYNRVSVSGRELQDIQNRIFTRVYVEDWIQEQNPSAYALQLIALPNEKFVEKFFDIYPLYDAEKAYFRSKKDGRNVYNIIYGVFDNQIAAQEGMENLPEDLKKKEPIIRKFETIQQYVSQRDS